MVMKKSRRGCVGRAIRRRERYITDEGFKEKRKKMSMKSYNKNKKQRIKEARRYIKELSEFANKKCKKCHKLLDYRTESGYCRKHWRLG